MDSDNRLIYRVWSPLLGNMFYSTDTGVADGYHGPFIRISLEAPDKIAEDPGLVFMQFTGEEIDGQPIFKNDILFFHRHWNECDCMKNWQNYRDSVTGLIVIPAGKVEGCKDSFNEYTEVVFNRGGFGPFPWAGEEGNPDADAYTLVGNRYQNPDLLLKANP
jgi:hypothetical protein